MRPPLSFLPSFGFFLASLAPFRVPTLAFPFSLPIEPILALNRLFSHSVARLPTLLTTPSILLPFLHDPCSSQHLILPLALPLRASHSFPARSLFLALNLFSFARYARYAPCSFADKELSDLDEVIGGSAWGAATVAAGDGSRQPTARELAIAKNQGKRFAETVATFVRGKQ